MLSILIPTYNYNVYPLVEDLHAQATRSGIAFEIIVLDDCSTKQIAENASITNKRHCHYMVNDSNLGRTQTRKKLAESAIYQMLLFLDADVIPVQTDFIKLYLPYIKSGAPLVFGGCAYHPENDDPSLSLRYKYGKSREEKSAGDRNRTPYSTIFSGNLLIDKDIFLENNFPGQDNLYGMDIYFSYKLFLNKVPVLHIDNPVYHMGLEDNTLFFKKALQSVESRKKMFNDLPGIEKINPLLKHYAKAKKYHMVWLLALGFRLSEPVLKKLVLSKNPNLFCMDIYRLGYLCSLR